MGLSQNVVSVIGHFIESLLSLSFGSCYIPMLHLIPISSTLPLLLLLMIIGEQVDDDDDSPYFVVVWIVPRKQHY